MKVNPKAIMFVLGVGLMCGGAFGLNAGLFGAGVAASITALV